MTSKKKTALAVKAVPSDMASASKVTVAVLSPIVGIGASAWGVW